MFNDILNETKDFKYQITLKALLKKYKLDGEIEFRPVYTNSVTKTMINHRFKLESSFQFITRLMKDVAGLLNLLSLNTLNILTYRLLSGSS